MARTLKLDIPGIDWRRPAELLDDESPEAIFAPEMTPPFSLVVEIGFGRGEFLLDMAAERPDTAFLGIELANKRVHKMARRMARMELENVRLVEGYAEPIVESGLRRDSVAEIWINCPDPWPKARHARRRLIQPRFVEILAERLVPGGIVYLTTDDVEYAQQMHEVLSKEPRLENTYAPSPWLGEVAGRRPTAYELEWRAEGRSMHFFAYRRRSAEPAP